MGRTRYRYYWYGICTQLLKQYPFEGDNSPMAGMTKQCIENVLTDTAKLPNGDERVKVIELVYLKKTDTIEGAALKVYASRRTVQRWLSSFIYALAKELGFQRRT